MIIFPFNYNPFNKNNKIIKNNSIKNNTDDLFHKENIINQLFNANITTKINIDSALQEISLQIYLKKII